MGNTDIVLTRVKQRMCPVCKAEFRPEWKDKFKPVQYKNGQVLFICKGHKVDEKIRSENR